MAVAQLKLVLGCMSAHTVNGHASLKQPADRGEEPVDMFAFKKSGLNCLARVSGNAFSSLSWTSLMQCNLSQCFGQNTGESLDELTRQAQGDFCRAVVGALL